jgi:hypothetical protein
MKKISVVADRYKMDKFREEFSKVGMNITETPGEKADLVVIKITCANWQFEQLKGVVADICKRVESHNKKSKEN